MIDGERREGAGAGRKPPATVGPHGQLEALEQAIIPAPGKDLPQVALERARASSVKWGYKTGCATWLETRFALIGRRRRTQS